MSNAPKKEKKNLFLELFTTRNPNILQDIDTSRFWITFRRENLAISSDSEHKIHDRFVVKE